MTSSRPLPGGLATDVTRKAANRWSLLWATGAAATARRTSAAPLRRLP
ncbi:hypothetical protein [Georgenia faecalis]|nr:hypothetical protein [Georgenia faecalis]